MTQQPRQFHWHHALPPRILVLIPVLFYAAGLVQHVTDRWVGLHDWNGAFYSQLARNLVRYPSSIHHGIPIVAVGRDTPPPEERSLYARHPPLLAWLLAADFWILGESEWTARLLPISASLGSIFLLRRIVERRRGPETAFYAALFFSVMPMTVFFGRMVDQEALCLFFMLATMTSWRQACERSRRFAAVIGTVLALTCAIWTDWAGGLFAVFFNAYVLLARLRKRIDTSASLSVVAVTVLSFAGLFAYLVHYGFGGRFADLIAVFQARTGFEETRQTGGVVQHVLQNLSGPLLVLWLAGLASEIGNRPKRADSEHSPPSGLGVILITGILWLLVFWRQFIIHNYWMFYLAPSIAASSAWALTRLRLKFSTAAPRAAILLVGATVVIVVVFAVRGTEKLFTIRAFQTDVIEAWRQIAAMTAPNDRVLLHYDPVATESHGSTCFRNIIPPQMAYYLDRPFDVLRPGESPFSTSRREVLFIAPAQHPAFSKTPPPAGLASHRLHQIGLLWAVELKPG